MRTIIAGSRTVRDAFLIDRAVEQAKLVGIIPTIVLSGCQKAWDGIERKYFGADYFGEQWVKKNGIPVERHIANWSTYGKRAGHFRNGEMVLRADALIAVWDGKSKGTSDCIRQAMTSGLLIHVEHF